MSSETEDLRGRLTQLETAWRQTAISEAIAGAIKNAGVPLREGVQEHLIQILRPSVQLHPDGRGGLTATGPSQAGLSAWVKDRLTSDASYAHFRAESLPSPAIPSAREMLPGESLGAAVVRYALSQRAEAQAIDPRTSARDMSQPFGIRRTGRLMPPI